MLCWPLGNKAFTHRLIFLVCACWSLIKRRPRKATTDSSEAFEWNRLNLSLFTWQGCFLYGEFLAEWEHTAMGMSSSPLPPYKHAYWEYTGFTTSNGKSSLGMSVATVLAASFWQSVQPHSNHLIILCPETEHFHLAFQGRSLYNSLSIFFQHCGNGQGKTKIQKEQHLRKVSWGDLLRVVLVRTAGERKAGLCLNTE